MGKNYKALVVQWAKTHGCEVSARAGLDAEVTVEAPKGHCFENDCHERVLEVDGPSIAAAWESAWQYLVRDQYERYITACQDAPHCCSWDATRNDCEWWGVSDDEEG